MRGLPPVAGLAVLLLAGCASAPSAPSNPPVHYRDAGIPAALLRGGIGISPQVAYPERLRYGSVTSRQPFYGMLSAQQAPGVFGSHQPPRLRDVFDPAATLTAEVAAQMRAQPRLAGALREPGRSAGQRLVLDMQRAGQFGMDMENRACQLTVIIRARLLDERDQELWTSGFVSSPVSDQYALPCDDLLRQRSALADGLGAAMRRAVTELVNRM